MKEEQLLSILETAAKLKTTYRHCYTEPGRRESVADHSWRIALMAMLLSGEEEFKDVDIDRVIRMCLIHDLGEVFTGDIPVFQKKETDEEKEDGLLNAWIGGFPPAQREEWEELLREMNALETPEAKLYKSLDKLEAIMAHNESELSTWVPLEYDLQLSYGWDFVKYSPCLLALRQKIRERTEKKIEEGNEKAFVKETHESQ